MILVPYGNHEIHFPIKQNVKVYYLIPKAVEKVEDVKKETYKAINNPLGHSLESFKTFRNVEEICIVVSDHTRPLPLGPIVEAILDKFEEEKVDPSKVTILVGGGLHETNEKAMRSILGERILRRVGGLLFHNAKNYEDLIYLGKTTRGTPIWLNRHYLEADKRIVIGAITPHQIVGYTGGAKGVAIGVAGYDTIENIHKLLTHPKAGLGKLDGNPAREEIDEIGRIAKIDLLINATLNYKNEVAKIFAGDWRSVFEFGVNYAKRLVEVPTPETFEVVITSPGGYPRDINVYQSQKALSAAEIVTRVGGYIVLAAECCEGIGDPVFEKVMESFSSPNDIIDYLSREGLRMGYHKAYLWSRTLLKYKIICVSKLNKELNRVLKCEIVNSPEEAIETISKKLTLKKIGVIPYASTIVPILKKEI
ncbi:MAG: nickel-dependent lactate racemase [Archaeoglobaceae archaeon]